MKKPWAARWMVVFSAGLAVLTILVYWRVGDHPFILLDDDLYVTDNPFVRRGITIEGILWAFSTFHGGNWHPLTWLSHMLDVELFGMNAGAHHLVNMLIHGTNAILLFWVFRRMTGETRKSAFVAALFAVHPLHVESVAWVAERKDLLCSFFFFLSLWAYDSYARRRRMKPFLALLLFFTLGLLSKPMLVTLPFLLLLLDWWPLGSFPGQGRNAPSWPSLILEKVPLFALSIASSLVTLAAQKGYGAVVPFQGQVSLGARAGNALCSYLGYLARAVWPSSLAVYYPHRVFEGIPGWRLLGALILLGGVTVAAAVQFRRRPYLPVGWFWYLGTLFPVIGLVQVGGQSMADRYTYIPLVGVFLAVAWGAGDTFPGWRHRLPVLGAAAIGSIALLVVASRHQISHWRSSETLFRHTLAVTRGNALIHNNLGIVLLREGKIDDSITHFRRALELFPNDCISNTNLGSAYRSKGMHSEAARYFGEALRCNPLSGDAHRNLGITLVDMGRPEEGYTHLLQALRVVPNDPKAWFEMGYFMEKGGRSREAIRYYREAVRLDPVFQKARTFLAVNLARQGEREEAINHLREALRVDPGDQVVRWYLMMAVQGDGPGVSVFPEGRQNTDKAGSPGLVR